MKLKSALRLSTFSMIFIFSTLSFASSNASTGVTWYGTGNNTVPTGVGIAFQTTANLIGADFIVANTTVPFNENQVKAVPPEAQQWQPNYLYNIRQTWYNYGTGGYNMAASFDNNQAIIAQSGAVTLKFWANQTWGYVINRVTNAQIGTCQNQNDVYVTEGVTSQIHFDAKISSDGKTATCKVY